MTPNQKMISIYILSHPVTKEVRYVGKTIKRLNDRLKIHIWAAQRNNKTHRCNWIRSLLADGMEPIISPIEIMPDSPIWAERGQYWIAKYKADGARLTNATAGGEGMHGLTHTDQAKEKIGAAHKGKIISVSQREKLATAMRGRTLSDDHRKKVSEAGKGRVVSDAVKIAISAAKSGVRVEKTCGEGNGRAKLTAQQAKDIRESSMTLSRIVLIYGISKSQASRVRRGIQWN